MTPPPSPQSYDQPILLVDNSPSNLEVLSKALTSAGYKVVIEVDGESAIAQVSHNSPMLILLDIKIPGIDGFEICRRIKALPHAAQIPIIFMTALDDTTSKVEGFALGAVDYITKPFHTEEVLARVKTHHEIYQLRRQLEQQNQQLQTEVTARQNAEQSLSLLNQTLEARVEERTAELRESEQRFRQLAENIQEVFWIANPDHPQLLYVSSAYETIWGRSLSSLYESNLGWFQSIHPDDQEAFQTALPKQQQGTYDEEYRIIRPDGDIRWIHDRAVPIRDDQGQIYRLVGIAQDISDRKQNELERDRSAAKIRNTQKFLQTVIDHIPVALFVKDGREEAFSQHLLWNQTSEDLFGIKVTDALYKTAYDLFPPEQAEFFIQKDREAFQRGTPEDIPEEPVDSKKLGRRILHTVKTPIYDEHQNPQYLLCFAEDITDRKRAEEELKVSEERLRLVLDATNDSVWDWDIENNTIFRSKRVYEFLGLSSDKNDLIYEDFYNRIHPDDREIFSSALHHYLDSNIPYKLEFRIKKADGQYGWFLDQAKVIRDQQGKAIRVVGALSDISVRKQAEAKIHTLNAELEQRVAQRTAQLEAVNHELESFSYSVSHDLRAPLRHIHGFINALRKILEKQYSPLDKTVIHYIEVVDESSKKMGRLIDGLLLLSRVGRRQIDPQQIDLNPIVKTTIDLICSSLESSQQQKIDWKIHSLPSVYGDKALIQQVFKNLISNAVKFSQRHKSPVIEVGITSDKTFFVKDNGIGFSMDYNDKLFVPFERLHSQREFQGTGIGLSIVQRIIHRHHGVIWAESQPEQGATFFFKLPQAPHLHSS